LDPESLQLATQIPLGGSEVSGLAVDGTSLWATALTTQPSGSELIRVDQTTDTIVERVPLEGGAWDVQVSDGYVWVSGVRSGSKEPALGRLDPRTGRVVLSMVPTFGDFVLGEGVLWTDAPGDKLGVGVSTDDMAAVPVDAVSGEFAGDPILLGDTGFRPFAIDDEGIWFLGGQGAATVNRLDPTTGDIDVSITVADHDALSASFDESADTVWVADEEADSIIRIDFAEEPSTR
jgi:streptogramin lyase